MSLQSASHDGPLSVPCPLPTLPNTPAAAKSFDEDPEVGAIVLTGSEKAFAAGADIKEMAGKEFVEVYNKNMFAEWADLTKIRKPVRAGEGRGGGTSLWERQGELGLTHQQQEQRERQQQ